MPKKASHEDLCQMFEGTVCIHKNKPFYISRISAGNKANCLDLISQETIHIPIDEENFTAPTQRLGYINIHGSVIYSSRIPIRRYKVGISKENLKTRLGMYKFKDGAAHANACVQALTSLELGRCILGKYPTFKQAKDKVAAEGGAVAFDRQFAIAEDNKIYYKEEYVGTVKASAKDVNDIIFSAPYKHLILLLDNNYEKTLSAARAS